MRAYGCGGVGCPGISVGVNIVIAVISPSYSTPFGYCGCPTITQTSLVPPCKGGHATWCRLSKWARRYVRLQQMGLRSTTIHVQEGSGRLQWRRKIVSLRPRRANPSVAAERPEPEDDVPDLVGMDE